MRRTLIVLVGLMVALGAYVPGVTAAPTTPPGTNPTQKVHVIVIDTMQFGAIPADIRAGDIIEWVNHDIFEHTATARDGSFDIDLKAGATARTVAKAGRVAVFCKFHPTMVATLIVH